MLSVEWKENISIPILMGEARLPDGTIHSID